MRKLLSVIVGLTLLPAFSWADPTPKSERVPGHILYRMKSSAKDDQKQKLTLKLKAHRTRAIKKLEAIQVQHDQFASGASEEEVCAELLETGAVEFCEPDFIGYGNLEPNDPNYGSQWHHAKIKSPAAWDMTTGQATQTIAIVDSGIAPTQPDLQANLVTGQDYLGASGGTSDVKGHGTAVAGSAGAIGHNSVLVAGVAWRVKLMPLRVLSAANEASYSNISNAIIFAADRGVRIINVSIGGTSSAATLDSAVTYAWNKGCVVFASAGNDSSTIPRYPAATPKVIGVSATDSNDALASFSNSGNWITLSAPGALITTTDWGGGISTWNGTSLASPIAAAVAALALSVNPSLTATQLVALLKQNSDDLGGTGFDNQFGYGRINAERVVRAAGGQIAYSKCDVNKDGTTSINDLQTAVNQAIGIGSCTSDVNGDGICTVGDVQRISNAVVGLSCVTQ